MPANPTTVDRLFDEVVTLARVDPRRAARVARLVRGAAAPLDSDTARARGWRAQGHALFASGRYGQSVERYRAAILLLRRARVDAEEARTLSSALQPLIYLGRYRQALAWAAQARRIFERHGDQLRLARLDVNVGNILARQDDFPSALAMYERAHDTLLREGTAQDVAAVLSNIGACLVGLNRCREALAFYDRARTHCAAHGMPLLVLQADCNIAQLRFRKGEYSTALALYDSVVAAAESAGDAYHVGLCDLGRAEIYLELDAMAEARDAAQQALGRFRRLGLRYEGAKATLAVAVALSAIGHDENAADLFAQAKKAFAAEGNDASVALVNLSLARVLARNAQRATARRLAIRAAQVFTAVRQPAGVAQCDLLMARLALADGRTDAAARYCLAAFERAKALGLPALSIDVCFLLGQIREAQGQLQEALAAYRVAHAEVEHVREHLNPLNLKIAFHAAQQPLYENLVSLSVAMGDRHAAGALRFVEQAKSPSVTEAPDAGSSALQRDRVARHAPLPALRQELEWYRRQIEVEQRQGSAGSNRTVAQLGARVRRLESILARNVGAFVREDLRETRWHGAMPDDVQAVLTPEITLLDYYIARGILYVWIVTRSGVEVVPLGPAHAVWSELQYLQLQLSKFRLITPSKAHDQSLERDAVAHLRQLHRLLIAPISSHIAGNLVIVPGGFLHRLPFHALFDGETFLVDRCAVSYAPSATAYRSCCLSPDRSEPRSLVMGVADASAMGVARELGTVARLLPSASLHVGAEATATRLRLEGQRCRYLHIASHAVHRHDNPLFSGIRLAEGDLNVLDLYQLQLSAELVTLSGCSTGLTASGGGAEVVGFMRGLLRGGARAALLTLWDVHDISTTEFMTAFYTRLSAGATKAAALQQATCAIRRQWPHPFHWAAFILVGKGHV